MLESSNKGLTRFLILQRLNEWDVFSCNVMDVTHVIESGALAIDEPS